MRAVAFATFVGTLLIAPPAAAVPGPPPLVQGWIATKRDPGRCLTGGPIGTVLHTTECRAGEATQLWYEPSWGGHLTVDGLCIEPAGPAEGAKVLTAECAESTPDWRFVSSIRVTALGPCLAEDEVDDEGRGHVSLRPCVPTPTQKWRNRMPDYGPPA